MNKLLRLLVFASAVLTVCAGSAHALGPHEVVLLANENSPDSIAIAKEYARLRDVHDLNILRVRVPIAESGVAPEISPEEFTRRIWTPAMRAMRDRGIEKQVLAWVYSTDFPTTIRARPALSIQGLTFLRNRLPDPDEVDKGTYVSPLFCGPTSPRAATFAPKTFDAWKRWLRDDMPLPSMMLGYTGERGNSKQTVLDCMKRGITSDYSSPSGAIYFVTSEDVRSRCRQWQFPGAASALRLLGVNAAVVTDFPVGKDNVAGLMMGAHTVQPDKIREFLPGAMAEHFTSFAGAFHLASQTKLSAWISAGATASSGAVTEPRAVWQKIPVAHFYAHQASGCTMMESFFLSVKCPLQILFVGEPLAQPWARPADLTIEGLENENVSARREIGAEVASGFGEHYRRFVYLIDGRAVGEGRRFILDPFLLKPGKHTLRVVGYRTGFVACQVFADKEFTVE